jgi:hypothetical protein
MSKCVHKYQGVIPVLVTGIHPSANGGARGKMDPGHKARDDVLRLALRRDTSALKARHRR